MSTLFLHSSASMLSSQCGLSQADVFITLWQMANSDYVNSQKREFLLQNPSLLDFFFNLEKKDNQIKNDHLKENSNVTLWENVFSCLAPF